MPTITSYFGFLLVALTITSVLFIGLSKIRLIWNKLNEQFIKRKENFFTVFRLFFNCVNFQFLLIEIYGRYVLIFKDRYYLLFFPFFIFQINWNDWSFSIWNCLRSNSYYFGRIIRNCIFTIQTWWSVGSLIN